MYEEIGNISKPKVVYALSYCEGRTLLCNQDAQKYHGRLTGNVEMSIENMYLTRSLTDGINRPYLMVEGYANECIGNFHKNIVGISFEKGNVSNTYVRFKYQFSNDELANLCQLGLFEEGFQFPTKLEEDEVIFVSLDINYTVVEKDDKTFVIAEVDHAKVPVLNNSEVPFVKRILLDKKLFVIDEMNYLNDYSKSYTDDFAFTDDGYQAIFNQMEDVFDEEKEEFLEEESTLDPDVLESEYRKEKMTEDTLEGAFYRTKAAYDGENEKESEEVSDFIIDDDFEENKKKKEQVKQSVIKEAEKTIRDEEIEDDNEYESFDDDFEL
ncbi:hypothetical protein [Filifactor alocis]|uniref:hypothetical protein n=1 Tax=Filifactor alocis TaxID=143361 RepID=UPI003F9FC568